ncbi:MAG TPA: thrombospondin type 3 repeat-containing protein, partial [Saprospiraceae bacterium]|nr:thrombospondin type 3 repeat-containing protein [Saprospiraceae bacterium]
GVRDSLGMILIQGNEALEKILLADSLVRLSTLRIENNQLLDTIRMGVGVRVSGNVVVQQNPLLMYCCFLSSLDIGGVLTLSGNDPACNSLPFITAHCDPDGDGVPFDVDNCPDFPNPLQQDNDHDGVGNACDNCPLMVNPDQADSNNNFIGNACETPEAGKVGINNPNPNSGLHIKNSDVYVDDPQRGLILKDFLGHCYRLHVDEDGQLRTIPINCPN